MKTIFQRYYLRHKIRRAAYHLDELARAEVELAALRSHFLRESGNARRRLMDLDIGARRA